LFKRLLISTGEPNSLQNKPCFKNDLQPIYRILAERIFLLQSSQEVFAKTKMIFPKIQLQKFGLENFFEKKTTKFECESFTFQM
jgi:hypothetical protein